MEVTLGYLLRRNANKFPDKEAIIYGEKRISYRELNCRTNKRANAIIRLGIKKGDHIATLFPNCNEGIETFYALFKIGAIPIPINIRLSIQEMIDIINHSDASFFIFHEDFVNISDNILNGCKSIKMAICSGKNVPEKFISFEHIFEEAPDSEPEEVVSEDDVACIIYTAGTTGRPKGVLLTHKNSIWAAINAVIDTDNKPEYKVLLVFPLFHVAAYTLLNTNIFIGCTTVIIKSFDPKLVLETIEREKTNRMTFPPTVWNFILRVPDLNKYDLSSVRSISSGAESMPYEIKKRLVEIFPNAKMGESYGMTESTGTISTIKPEDVMRKYNSVGKPFTNVEVRIVDQEDRDVRVREIGEIVFKGPTMMKGYYKEPEMTKEALRGGWMHTGDLGWFDEEGFLYIVDRKKDLIISGGENIYPKEVEDVIYRHPKVLEVAVIGLPDPVWGERVHAVVVPKDNEQLSEQEIIEFCKDKIASFKKPKSVSFVNRLPRNSAGKILKNVLKEQLKSKPE